MAKLSAILAGGVLLASLAGCTDRQLNCAGGATAGGALGGVIGNQLGGGDGRTAMTVLGAGAGAYTGSRAAGC